MLFREHSFLPSKDDQLVALITLNISNLLAKSVGTVERNLYDMSLLDVFSRDINI